MAAPYTCCRKRLAILYLIPASFVHKKKFSSSSCGIIFAPPGLLAGQGPSDRLAAILQRQRPPTAATASVVGGSRSRDSSSGPKNESLWIFIEFAYSHPLRLLGPNSCPLPSLTPAAGAVWLHWNRQWGSCPPFYHPLLYELVSASPPPTPSC